MFDNKKLDEWLDQRADEALKKFGAKETIPPEEMMILMLKAQSNHFMHLDSDLRSEMKHLREDMAKQFAATDKRFEAVDKRFEAVDKRFEAVDRRFAEAREDMREQRSDMNKRFAFTQWLIGFGITLIVAMMSLYQFLQPPK